MRRDVYPYIKYDLPNGVTFILTPRPDAYTPLAVKSFVEQFNPKIRFQFTDDQVECEQGPNFHWYPWIAGKRLPTELVWAALSLIHKHAQTSGVIWMHCDSSSMRAPTFFGHYLRVTQSPELIEDLISKAAWTDGRHQSRPDKYSETSIGLDPGMKELIEAWQNAGEQAAYQEVMRVDRWPFEGDAND